MILDYLGGANAVSKIILKGGDWRVRVRDNVTTEAKVEVVPSWAKECGRPLEAGRGEEQILLQSFQDTYNPPSPMPSF